MTPPPPGLLACDLDGTIIDAAGRPHPGVREALVSLVAAGVPLAVCTGRPLHAAERLTGPLGVSVRAFICYHGALVVDTASGAWLRHLAVPQPRAFAIARDAMAAGLSATLYAGDERIELAPGLAPRLAPTERVTRIILTGEATTIDAAWPALRGHWTDDLRVERAHPTVIDVLDARADKGTALVLLAAHLGVRLEHVVACGDSRTDESLLRVAGNAVAVEGPTGDLHGIADVVVAPQEFGAFLRSLVG